MIETPALFPSLSAHQNMEVQRLQRGIPDKTVIDKCLHMVHLEDTGKKRSGTFPWECASAWAFPPLF